jgi:hypothetical protein
MTPDGIIVLFLAHGANDALRGLMTDYGRAFEEFGRSILNVEIGESVAELRYATDLMQKGQVDFCMTWLGIGQDLSFTSRDGQPPRNAFELTQVPLLKIQGDLPAYLPDRHRDVPCNSANLYQADEFVQFRDRFIPEARSPAFLLPPMPMVPIARSSIDVSSRRAGKLVFLKNGNSPAALRELWRQDRSHSRSDLSSLRTRGRRRLLAPLDVADCISATGAIGEPSAYRSRRQLGS